MKRKFTPKERAHVSETAAQDIGEVIDEITETRGDGVDPDDLAREILERARPEHSRIHGYFEWDNSRAADAYRLSQAKYYIRSIEVIPHPDAGDTPYRQVVVLPKEDGSSVYMRTEKVLANKEWREIYLDRAQRDIIGMQRRYSQLTELCAVLDQTHIAIEELRSRTVKGVPASEATAGA